MGYFSTISFVRELGLIMTQINGEPLDFSKAGPFIISNPELLR